MLDAYGIRPSSRVAVLVENGTMLASIYEADPPQHIDFDRLRRYLVSQCDVRRFVYYLSLDRNPAKRDSAAEVQNRARLKWLQYNGYSVQTREYDSRYDHRLDRAASFDAMIASDMMLAAFAQRVDFVLLMCSSSGLAFPAARCAEHGVPVVGVLPVDSLESSANSFLRSSLSGTLRLADLLQTAECLSARENAHAS